MDMEMSSDKPSLGNYTRSPGNCKFKTNCSTRMASAIKTNALIQL